MENTPFDSILPGLTAGKYDLGISSFTDTLDRQKTNDFVTYAQAGTSFYGSADSDVNAASLDDLCGQSVAVEKGTTQQEDAEAQDKKCQVDVQVYPDQNGANLAISSGRAELGMADSPVAAYIVEQSDGKFKLGEAYGVAPYGIAMKKGSGAGPAGARRCQGSVRRRHHAEDLRLLAAQGRGNRQSADQRSDQLAGRSRRKAGGSYPRHTSRGIRTGAA